MEEAARRGGKVRTTSAMAVVEAPPPLAPLLEDEEEESAAEEVAALSSAAKSSRWGLGRAPVSPPPLLLSTLPLVVSLGVMAVEAAAAVPGGLAVRAGARPANCCRDLRRRIFPFPFPPPLVVVVVVVAVGPLPSREARSWREPFLPLPDLGMALLLALPPEMRWLVRWMTPVMFFMALVVACKAEEGGGGNELWIRPIYSAR